MKLLQTIKTIIMKLASKTGQVNYRQKGEPGDTGPMVYPAGEYSATVSYTRTVLSTPMVLDDGQYYVLAKTGTFTGIRPKTDYAQNGSSATWLLVEKLQYVFAEALMANFARLASAVFYGQYMFSQYGTNASGKPVETQDGYKDFNPANPMAASNAFRPNLLLDFLAGDIRTRTVHLRMSNNAKDEVENGSVRLGNGIGLLPELEPGECRQIWWVIPLVNRTLVGATLQGESSSVSIARSGDALTKISKLNFSSITGCSFNLVGFNDGGVLFDGTIWMIYPMSTLSEQTLNNATEG